MCDACEGCGYDANGDRRNLAKHKKRCPKRSLHLQRTENTLLRAQMSTGMAEVESRTQAQLDDMRSQLQQIQATLTALVPAQPPPPTTIHNTTTNNIAIQINICAFEDTPRPPKKKIKNLFQHPATSVPNYFNLKHCAAPSSRNLKVAHPGGNTISVYTKTKEGPCCWIEKDKTITLATIVDGIINELLEHGGDDHKEWYEWCKDEGLTKSDCMTYPAFKGAEDEIHTMLVNGG